MNRIENLTHVALCSAGWLARGFVVCWPMVEKTKGTIHPRCEIYAIIMVDDLIKIHAKYWPTKWSVNAFWRGMVTAARTLIKVAKCWTIEIEINCSQVSKNYYFR